MTIPADIIDLLMQSVLRRFDDAQRVFRARIAGQTAGTAKRCSCSPLRPECARCDEVAYAWWSKEEPK